MNDLLTNRERCILNGPMEPYIMRYDFEETPDCDHCTRSARYMIVLGDHPEESLAVYANDVCDVCFEAGYTDINEDLPMAARLHRDNLERLV